MAEFDVAAAAVPTVFLALEASYAAPEDKEGIRLLSGLIQQEQATPGQAFQPRDLTPWIKRYFIAKEYPWIPWAAGAGIVFVLGGIGYAMGRTSKRCRATTA